MTEVVLKDRVKETSITTGPGSMLLEGAVQGYQSFAAIGNGNLTFYTISNATDWEVGIGMYFTSGPTLERNVVLDSSNNGALVSWTSGEKEVFVTYPSSIADYIPPSSVFEYLTQTFTGTGSIGSATALSPVVDYLVVAGGGGGGAGLNATYNGGGGGAGGFITSSATLNLGSNYTVTVGAGGANSANGSNSSVFSTTSIGGGRGGTGSYPAPGASGGSGGGGTGGGNVGAGGAGTAGQGNNGGSGGVASAYRGGGGGGAGGVGVSGASGGTGGEGSSSSLSGSSVTYAGGGGGAASTTGGAGGSGGGGAGGSGSTAGTAATVNTGGGGGGGAVAGSQPGGAGGSGVIILKYPDSFTISNPGGGLTFSTSTAVSGYKITTFTQGTGNIQWST